MSRGPNSFARAAAGAGALLIFLATGLWPSAAHAHGPTVTIGHNRISPAEVVIAPGETVHFHSVDQMPGGHSLVADDGSFKSPALARNEDWHHKFEEVGSFTYHIAEHPTAVGVIVVQSED